MHQKIKKLCRYINENAPSPEKIVCRKTAKLLRLKYEGTLYCPLGLLQLTKSPTPHPWDFPDEFYNKFSCNDLMEFINWWDTQKDKKVIKEIWPDFQID